MPRNIPFNQASKGMPGGFITDREQLIIKQLNLIRKIRELLKQAMLIKRDEIEDILIKIEENLNNLEKAIEENTPERITD